MRAQHTVTCTEQQSPRSPIHIMQWQPLAITRQLSPRASLSSTALICHWQAPCEKSAPKPFVLSQYH
jgi:hypothetical protein